MRSASDRIGTDAASGDAVVYGWFEQFLSESGPKLRRAFVARYGLEVGCDIHADALAWGWEHADELAGTANPAGYLFRVGQTAARRHRRWYQRPLLPAVDPAREPSVEPGLPSALARLRADQRTAVVLVHCFGWTYAEVADLLGISVAAVTNHVHRGLKKLRQSLGVDP